MKERPILFSGPMVRAILEGRKTMTRRTRGLDKINKCPDEWPKVQGADGMFGFSQPGIVEGTTCIQPVVCPYGVPGDRLWVKWRPSIITLEVLSIRVERVQEISEADVIAEGCGLSLEQDLDVHRHVNRLTGGGMLTISANKAAFGYLWDAINFKRGFGWDYDPWVWVIKFRRVK